MKIVFIVGTFPTIFETFILNQIIGLLDLGHDVDIFAKTKGEVLHPIREDVIKYDLLSRTYYFDVPQTRVKRCKMFLKLFFKNFYKNPILIIKLLNFVKYGSFYSAFNNFFRVIPFLSQNYDVVHCHFGPEGVRMLPIKKELNLPLVTTFYGYDMSELAQENEWQVAYKVLFRDGDLFLVEGSHMKDGLMELGCPPEKIRIQHIAVDVNRFKYQQRRLKDKDGKIRVLFCGRFVEKKGLIYALQAIRLIVNKFPNLEFRIMGDGKLRPEIESFIAEQNMGKYVVLLGKQPHYVFAEETQKAHILLQPSVTAKNGDSEGGAPTVLLEAQASGLPIVSTYHADIPEVVVNGKSGFLVAEHNVRALAERLNYLISNSGLWPEMGEHGRKHIEENYNIYKEVKKLENIYLELL